MSIPEEMYSKLKELLFSKTVYAETMYTDAFYLRDPIDVLEEIGKLCVEYKTEVIDVNFGTQNRMKLAWILHQICFQIDDIDQSMNIINSLYDDQTQSYYIICITRSFVDRVVGSVLGEMVRIAGLCGLYLNDEEVQYLNNLTNRLGCSFTFANNAMIDKESPVLYDTSIARGRIIELNRILLNTLIIYSNGVCKLLTYHPGQDVKFISYYMYIVLTKCVDYSTAETDKVNCTYYNYGVYNVFD